MAFTYFFRDPTVLDMIAVYALPHLKCRQYIRVWDAGCAMGPEPYSLAIILRENMGKFLFRNVRILATDIDESDFGAIINEGVYSEEQIKRIPAEIRKKYFLPKGDASEFAISDEIKHSIRFQRHDLLSLSPISQDFGLIICKNVLLHFREAERVEVLKMFHGALEPGGYLAMEQTQKLPREAAGLFSQVVSNAQLFKKIEQSQATPL